MAWRRLSTPRTRYSTENGPPRAQRCADIALPRQRPAALQCCASLTAACFLPTQLLQLLGCSWAFVISFSAMVALSWGCVSDLHPPGVGPSCFPAAGPADRPPPPLFQEIQADIAAVRLDDSVRQGAIERIQKTRLLYESKERVGVNPLFRLVESSRGLSTHPPTALRLWLARHVPPGDTVVDW